VLAAAVAAVVMWAVQGVVPGASRAGAVVEVVAGGGVGVTAYAAVAALLGGPRPSTLPSLLRGQRA
jgi:hypothetical protein